MTDKLSFKFDGNFTLEGDAATFKKTMNTYIKLPQLLGQRIKNSVKVLAQN